MKRITLIAALAAPVIAAAISLAGAGAASASVAAPMPRCALCAVKATPLVQSPAAGKPSTVTNSFQCQQDGFCGDQVLPSTGHPGLGMNVKGNVHKANTPVIVYSYSSSNPGEDFIMKHFTGNPDQSKSFEWAPNDVPSGFCLSFPTIQAGSPGVLRNCNQGPWQTFIPAGPNQFGNFQWSVEAGTPNNVITGNVNTKAQLRLGVSTGADVQEWLFTQGVPIA